MTIDALERLAREAKELAEKATAGPWLSTGGDVLPSAWIKDGKVYGDRPFVVTTMRYVEAVDHPDTALIAASRTLVPSLADAVLRLVAVAKAAEIHVRQGGMKNAQALSDALSALAKSETP